VLALVTGLMVAGAAVIGTTVLTLQRRGLSDLSLRNSGRIAEVVTRSVEASMEQGQLDVTRTLVADLHEISGVKDVEVMNGRGGRAFEKGLPIIPEEILRKLQTRKGPVTVETETETLFYRPMLNRETCATCHARDAEILGVVMVTLDTTEVRNRFSRYVWFAVWGSLAGILSLSLCLILMLRKVILKPVKEVVEASHRLSEGDLGFNVESTSRDELGVMVRDLKHALLKVALIVNRIRDVADRVGHMTERLRQDARDLLQGTTLEAGAIESISSSVEQLTMSMSIITGSVDELSRSAEETAATSSEMFASSEQVVQRTRDLFEAVDETSASIEEMSSAINEVAGAAGELALSAEDTMAAIEEIGASIREVERSAKDSVSLSRAVAQSASGEGMETVHKTVEGMNRIRASVVSTSEQIKRLSARSEDIGSILGVIDEVTDQTTLLSLNASILAAQAGDHGRGFSVVARQIKGLAAKTADSTKEIAELIRSVQTDVGEVTSHMQDATERVAEGIQLSEAAMAALARMVEVSSRSSEMSCAIERVTAEQAKSVQVVTTAMAHVRDRVEQIAKATSEQNKGSKLINASADHIRILTSQVEKSMVEQSGSSRQIAEAVERVSEGIQRISRGVREQKVGTDQILGSLEKIRNLPEQNRDISGAMNRMVREVAKDSDLLATEVGRFKTNSRLRAEKTLRLGVVPLESPSEMYRKFLPFSEYLTERLGLEIELRVTVDFQETIRDLEDDRIDLAFMTPTTYIEAKEACNARVIARAQRSERAPAHRAAIVVRDDSGYRSLSDLKGCSFAFGDERSTSSHLAPRAMLMEVGLGLDDLRAHEYLGHHDEVAEAVLRKEYDAGGLMESVAFKYASQGLRILARSEEIAEFNICVSPFLAPPKEELLKRALFSLNVSDARGRQVLESINPEYTAFIPATDQDYDAVRQMLEKLGRGSWK